MLNFDSLKENVLLRNPCVLEKNKEDNLIEWKDINRLLNSGILDYPQIRIAGTKDEYSKNYNGFISYELLDRGARQAWIIPGVIYKNLKDGCTIIIDRCEVFFPKIKEIIENIGILLSCRVWANLYISPKGISPFKCHFDDHDVLAIQIYGKKLWKIYEPTYRSPNRGEKSFYLPPPLAEPSINEILTSKKIIYVPSGYWHNVETLSPLSLHMSIGLDFPRRLDIINLIKKELEKDIFFRDILPQDTASDDLKQRYIEAIKDMNLEEMIYRINNSHSSKNRKFNIFDIKNEEN